MITNDTYINLEISGEECCELCCEIIHNHFNCPACGEKDAPTNCYYDLYGEKHSTIGCESCGARFRLIEGEPYSKVSKWMRL